MPGARDASPETEQLSALATHLGERREALLRTWRQAAENDPELTTASTLSRSQFRDHIPEVLDAFERRLCARHRTEMIEAALEQKEGAAGHGVHRWQQGYQQREVMWEWRHLQLCLVDELERYAAEHPDLAPGVMPKARRALAELCSEGVCESAGQYARFQQTEAAGRVRDLEEALRSLSDLEQQRAEAWREAAHDLRGNLGAVKNATELLHDGDVPDAMRERVLVLLQKGVTSLHELLTDLMSLARLEAGQEERLVASFDAASMLQELCDREHAAARARGLFLATEGPPALLVEGDAVKTRRIAQNLVLNALKFTERGGVKVTWQEHDAAGAQQWILCVQDTGPGFQTEAAAPLAYALEQATQEAHAVEERDLGDGAVAETAPAPTLASQSERKPMASATGEGIGLSIVKRLCDLLDASLELETESGRGSTFRVTFPRRYEAAP